MKVNIRKKGDRENESYLLTGKKSFKLCQHITVCCMKKNVASLHNACCLKSLQEADYT